MQYDTQYSYSLNVTSMADISFSRFLGGRNWNGGMDNAKFYYGVASNAQIRAEFQTLMPDTYVDYFGFAC